MREQTAPALARDTPWSLRSAFGAAGARLYPAGNTYLLAGEHGHYGRIIGRQGKSIRSIANLTKDLIGNRLRDTGSCRIKSQHRGGEPNLNGKCSSDRVFQQGHTLGKPVPAVPSDRRQLRVGAGKLEDRYTFVKTGQVDRNLGPSHCPRISYLRRYFVHRIGETRRALRILQAGTKRSSRAGKSCLGGIVQPVVAGVPPP